MSSLVTHVILTYNDIDDLIKTLASSIGDIKGIKDILIVDDGSVEPVEPVLSKIYNFPEHKIKVIRNKVNLGINRSINRAIEETSTEYIYLGSCNDKVDSELFVNHTAALEKYTSAALAFSDPGVYLEKKKQHQDFHLNLASDITYFSPEKLPLFYRSNPFHIGANTAVFRTSELKKIGFKEDLGLYADWFTVYFLSFYKGCVYTPKVFSYYCTHEGAYHSIERRKDQSECVRKFFSYTKKMNPEIYERYKVANFISAFPLKEVLKVYKDPDVAELINVKSVGICLLRYLWNTANKILPVFLRNLVRKAWTLKI